VNVLGTFAGGTSRTTAWLIVAAAIGPVSFSLHALAQSASARLAPSPATQNAPLHANSDVEPIRVEFQSPSGCGEGAAFLGNVLGRTSKARGATALEMARVFRVSVTERRGESSGEISVQRPGEATLVRFSASGRCQDVLDTLAQFAALVVDPSVALASTRDSDLPENPYRNWDGPLAEKLPENPYRHWKGDLAPSVPDNPYRKPAVASSPALPENPYRNYRPPPKDLLENPYRRR